MPPKRRLPRRAAAQSGELNLESVAAERIDAVTCEPLHIDKYIEILSPDKTLRLYYNTSTLIRIATDHGKFMQPPHFREPMTQSLQRLIERIEGKKFHFQQRDVHLLADGTSREGFAGNNNDGGINVLHRHVYFDEIMDQFYLLNPAEVYVCPVCYEHYVQTRYIPHLHRIHRRVDYVNNGEQPVIDPLDVLSHMNRQEYSIDEENNDDNDDDIDVHGNETISEQHVQEAEHEPVQQEEEQEREESELSAEDNPLIHIVFRRAQLWKRHLAALHCIHDISAADYRLRDVLCTYHSLYNLLNDQRYEAQLARGNAPRRKWALTQQRYWHVDARFNVLRYNRVVEAVENAEVQAAHTDSSLYSLTNVSAFPGEEIATDMNPTIEEEEECDDDDDNTKSAKASCRNGRNKKKKGKDKKKKEFDNFIVNDDSLSSSEDDGYIPRYHPPDYLDSNNSYQGTEYNEYEEEQEEENETLVSQNDKNVNNRPNVNQSMSPRSAEKHKSKRQQALVMSSSSSSSSSLSSSASSSSTIDEYDTESSSSVESLEHPRKKKAKYDLFYKDGVFAPQKYKYDRLSAEDRYFVEAMSQKKVAPSQLYDPVLYHVEGGDGTSQRVNDKNKYSTHDLSVSSAEKINNYNDSNDIDWENIGEELQRRSGITKIKSEPTSLSLQMQANRLDSSTHKLLIDDNDDTDDSNEREIEDNNVSGNVGKNKVVTDRNNVNQPTRLLLLDDED